MHGIFVSISHSYTSQFQNSTSTIVQHLMKVVVTVRRSFFQAVCPVFNCGTHDGDNCLHFSPRDQRSQEPNILKYPQEKT